MVPCFGFIISSRVPHGFFSSPKCSLAPSLTSLTWLLCRRKLHMLRSLPDEYKKKVFGCLCVVFGQFSVVDLLSRRQSISWPSLSVCAAFTFASYATLRSQSSGDAHGMKNAWFLCVCTWADPEQGLAMAYNAPHGQVRCALQGLSQRALLHMMFKFRLPFFAGVQSLRGCCSICPRKHGRQHKVAFHTCCFWHISKRACTKRWP